MRNPLRGIRVTAAVLLLGAVAFAQAARAADVPYDVVVQYLLETVRAFRTAYVLSVVEHLREGGIAAKEDWVKDTHAVPLPAQFVKEAGAKIESYEVSLIGLTPINRANLPKTQAEADTLVTLSTDRSKRLLTFSEGDVYKGMVADLAIVQSCVDCHNEHPRSQWRKYRRGDVMGALVVRVKKGR